MSNYPRGKLNKEDQGATMLAIGTERDTVRIEFFKPMKWIALHPDEAEAFAKAIIEKAAIARRGMQ